MTSIDAAGHTLSTAETGTTRERRPPSRRKAAPWGVANRINTAKMPAVRADGFEAVAMLKPIIADRTPRPKA